MAVYVVRHAHAGDRSKWKGPDDLRPLSKKGRRQAGALVGLLAGEGVHRIHRILSSPSLRCVQTVDPLAAHLGLSVEVDDALAEGASEDEVVDLVRKVAAENAALCTHGDVIPTLLEGLERRDGLELPDGYPCAKGSVWVLEEDADGRFVSARYLAAP